MRLESDQHARADMADQPPPAQGVRPPLRVSLLDGSELVTTGFASMLAPHGERVRVVPQAHAATSLVPCDLLLVDFALMPPATVEDLLERAMTVCRVVSYSWHGRPPSGPWWSVAAGRVSGHLTKSLPAATLLERLEAIHRGSHTEGTRSIRPGRRGVARDGQRRVAGRLTPRERDIVSRIARGMSNAEIAGELFLSINSVKTYVRAAYRKMGVTTRSQAVAWWFASEVTTDVPTDLRPDAGRAASG